jgi:mono/diheme cytochrome c family protein
MVWCISCAEKPANQNTVLRSGIFIYQEKCKACHGDDGNLGATGAKNLRSSALSAAEIKKMILQGKGAMPPMGHDLDEAELDSLVQMVLSLRK